MLLSVYSSMSYAGREERGSIPESEWHSGRPSLTHFLSEYRQYTDLGQLEGVGDAEHAQSKEVVLGPHHSLAAEYHTQLLSVVLRRKLCTNSVTAAAGAPE